MCTCISGDCQRYLAGEHGTEVVTAGGQDNPVSWKICVLHPQSDVAQRVALAKRVHCIEDGFGVRIGHDVFGSHAALTIARGSQATQGVCANREKSTAENNHQEETVSFNRRLVLHSLLYSSFII